jgi:hypothetical protein
MDQFCRIPAKAALTMVLVIVLAVQAQVPNAPTLSSPANNATMQATSLTLKWNAVTGASSYTLQLSLTSAFSTFIINAGGIASTSQLISGLAGSTPYYWRVSAAGAGGTGAWSGIWSFTTFTPLSTPLPISPANGAINLPLTVTLNWSTSSGATSYQIVGAGGAGISNQILTTTAFSIGGLRNSTSYYWQVQAINLSGSSNWSVAWSFTTGPLTATPTLAMPSNGTINVPLSPTLSWNSVASATSYDLRIFTDTLYNLTIINQTGISSVSANIEGLLNSSNYFWQVRAIGPYGTGNWSTLYSFSTPDLTPVAPLLSLPSNNATDVSNAPDLTWQAGNIDTFNVQVSTSSNFSTTIYNQTVNARTFGSAPLELSNYFTYFWRVNAKNSLGSSPWSAIWTFTISAQRPTVAPVLISPADGASIALSTTFSWGIVAGATSYHLSIIMADETSINLSYDTVLTTTNWNNSAALSIFKGWTPFWTVTARNGSGTSPTSASRLFTLPNVAILSRPTAAAPAPAFSFRHSTVLYTLASPSPVELSLFSLSGRRIPLFSRFQSPGSYSFSLKKRNVSPGMYFLHFKAGTMEKRMKVVWSGG